MNELKNDCSPTRTILSIRQLRALLALISLLFSLHPYKMTQQVASASLTLREHKFLAFLSLLVSNNGAGGFKQDSARFEAWNDAFAFGHVGAEPIYTPKTPLQTRLRPATGLDNCDSLLIAQKLGDAIHARLTIREITIVRDRRLTCLNCIPVRNSTGIKVIQSYAQLIGVANRCPPAVLEIGSGFQWSKCAILSYLPKRAQFADIDRPELFGWR